MANSIWDELEEVKSADDFSDFESPNTKQINTKQQASVWDNLEEVKPTSPIDDEYDLDFGRQENASFAENHPFVSSLPEAAKQFGTRTVKSYPEFAKGTNDLLALIGDKTNLKGLSDFGRSNADFWEQQSNKIQIDPKYQGVKGLSDKSTIIPTIAGSVGDQATNLLMAMGGGAGGAAASKAAGLGKIGTAAATIAGTSIPNLAQEGTYLDKIQAFQQVYGRIPTEEELKQIQNAALGEKAINTALETVADRLLFGKLFPKGATTKSIKNIAKNTLEQAATEAGTEAMQEGVSIGAEKLLGINQGDNLGRILDSAAIGGITGGVMGGVGTAASQPYDTQFEETPNATNPINAIKKVSAKIVDGGKTLYNSMNDIVNSPENFDILRQLSKDGYPNGNIIEEIAPNTVNKQKVEKTQEQKNINNNVQPELKNENITEEESQELENIAQNQEIQEKLKNKREIAKENAKNQAIEKIKELAPNTAEKQEGLHTKDFQKGDFVKDIYSGEVFEVIEPDQRGMGKLRNVDDDTVSTINAHNNAHFTKYQHNNNELIEKQEFKYDIKANGDTNSHNYAYSQQEVIDAYNNYVKNPTTENKEKYQDTYGKYIEEFRQKEESYKQQDTTYKLAPNTVKKQKQKQIKPTNEKQEVEKAAYNILSMASGKNPTYIKMLLKSTSEKIAKQREKFYETVRDVADQISINGVPPEYAKYFDIAAFGDDFSKDAEANHNDNLKLVEQALNIIENGYKSPEDKVREEQEEYGNYINNVFSELEEKFKNVKTLDDFLALDTYINENIPDDIIKYNEDKFQELYNSAYERVENAINKGEENEYNANSETNGRTKDEKEPENDIRTTQENSVSSSQRNNNENDEREIRGVENERKTDKTTESDKQDERRTPSRQVGTEDKSSENNRGSNSTSGRSDNAGLESQRGLSQKHAELINTEYKNQHELNTKIEDFVNNEEYRQYQPGDRFPQALKDWLKRYTGAGGLEKQGAEGKGLLSEYYTPQNIVKKMWELTKQYVKTDGAKVLEPSVGIGRFLENAPKNTKFDVVEINPVSARITKILYPDANVTTGEFQERFIDKTKNTPIKNVNPEYDIAIGNPPYGQYSGRYKGLGEGKKFSRLETYFINRSLDLLKENGVATFIVPSSFLDSVSTSGKQEISTKCELVDAYRLPENTFDTTTIGTDIIVLRKRPKGSIENNINSGEWFKQHPEKVLGIIEERKNRFGKQENYVKGDKNAVESIDTSKTDIKETRDTQTKAAKISNTQERKERKTTTNKNTITQKGQIEYEEYIPENVVSEEDEKYFRDTQVDGTLPRSKYSPNEKVNQYDGKLYNDFNYLQGDIYKKLDALENENISDKQKEIQRKKLNSVLPKPKKLSEIGLTPTSDFIREIPVTETVYDRYSNKEITRQTFYDNKYLNYVNNLTTTERNGINIWDINKFVNGDKIQTKYRGNPTKEEKSNQRAEFLTKLKNTVDKTFNDFLNSELSTEEREKIQDLWNRKFNTLYTPDYKKMPMLVKGLRNEFYGKPLKLQDVQIEGINYLTNKGVGLLGFEVGVGKTLSGIISTVQNMQMGRCRKPLILVPKQVKPNWIREIKETFPNIKINDIDNLSKFSGEIEDGSLSIGTYQALDNLWYNPDTIIELTSATYSMGNDFNRKSTKRGKEKTKERFEEFIGKAEAGNKKKFTMEELGFDHITVDEAHNFKNLFADAKADGQEGNTYSKITGAESTRAKRLFLATQYILRNNKNRNVFMLTATPFNNSPLEVFNMLSYMAKDKLENMGIYNVYQFMENYVDISADWVVDSKNNVVFKQIASGFKNLQSLQSVIDNCMLIRSAEDAGIKRPNKHTIRVTLDPTQEQLDLIAKAEAEAVGMEIDEDGNVRYKDPSNKRNNGEVLKAISKARTATISPDIYNNNLGVSPEDFIKNSPKLNYVMNAVESMKKKDPTTSQLIYMPIGVDFLPKIKQYLINKGVYKNDEIAIIKSGIDDDKINEITDSFNDENGKVKLIIGTNKIKEGMNLNKNSSVLYVPYMDWNPTDFLQIVGRIWRRGNKYKDIRVIVPLLKDSSDPFMFQKLDEKTSRINNIMDRGKNYIDTSELDTAEEKINMIANPEKKAAMFSQIEKQKLESEKNKLQGQLDDTRYYKKELEKAEQEVKYASEEIERYEKQLEEYKDRPTSWQYTSAENYLSSSKKDLSKAKQHLKYVQTKIEKLELDFNGKDSETAIQDKIQETEKKLEKLKETTEKKLVEFREEYEKNRKNGKSIAEYIKDFENDTDSLYGNTEQYYDEKKYNKNDDKDNDSDLSHIHEVIKNNSTIKEIVNLLQLPEEDFLNVLDYTSNITNKRANGSYNGSNKTISFNIDRIGNNEELLIETLIHETEHGNQHKEYTDVLNKIENLLYKDKIKNLCNYNYCKNNSLLEHNGNKELNKYLKWSGLTKADENIIRRMRESAIANGELQEFNKLYEDKLNDIIEQTITISILKNKKIIIPKTNLRVVKKYCELYEKYCNAKNEIAAKKSAIKYKEQINEKKQKWRDNNGHRNIQSNAERYSERTNGNRFRGNAQKQNGTIGKRQAGRNRTVGEEQYSIDEKNNNTESEKINQIARDEIYEWHSGLATDRYDVDKTLNSFINLSKTKAKQLSSKFGMKISDKQLREILPFLRERTGFPESLERDDLRKIFNKLTKEDKAELTKFADNVSDKFEKYYENYKDAKGTPDAENIENHISHIWDLDEKKSSLLTNYITTSSRFAKQRTIGTLIEGIEGIQIGDEIVKFKPKTLDYAEILKSSSDNLIKATHDSLLAERIKNLKYKKRALVLAAAKAPSDWVEINHPALSKAVYKGSVGEEQLPLLMKTSVKVHPAIANYIGSVFEVQNRNKVWDAYDTLNGIIKQALLGFSGFHGYALSESAIGNIGVKNTLKDLNPKKFIEAIKNGKYEIYENEENAKKAIKAGVKLGTPSDLNRNMVEDAIGKLPVIGKILSKAVGVNNKILWDVLHNNYKIMAFNAEIDRLEKLGQVTKEQERAVAQWVNDSFGGQAWELLGIKNSAVKTAGRILLSPDWNFSTIRQALGGLNSNKVDNILNDDGTHNLIKRAAKLSGISENINAKGVRGQKARAFWLKSAIFFTLFYNIINAAFREKDRKEHPNLYPKKMTPFDYTIWANSYPMENIYDKAMPKVFIGRNSNGTSRMLRVGKQFRELPEFITEPVTKLGGKTSPLINIASQVGFGMSPGDVVKRITGKDAYLNQDIWDGYGENAQMRTGKDALIGRTKALGKSLVPYISSKYIGGRHEFSGWDFVAQTSSGVSKGKIYKQTLSALENGNFEEIKQIKQHAYKDGLKKEEINKMVGFAQKNYKAANTKKYKNQFIEAIENKDKKELNRIKTDMQKNKLTPEEQRRIYKLAWEEYRKN